ncbi:hemerythrin domain-containing protein [bacterium]|nr:MAG: hemerythrin domain-containing protein [bacterium]
MSEAAHSTRETLDKDHRVFERLADALDRSRLRPPAEMRELVAATLGVLEPALKSHEALETALMGDVKIRRPGLTEGLRVASLQHDAIASLLKDLRIILSEPGRYRAEHMASLTFLLARNLREHLRYEEEMLWSALPEGGPAAPASSFEDLRRLETLLGRL